MRGNAYNVSRGGLASLKKLFYQRIYREKSKNPEFIAPVHEEDFLMEKNTAYNSNSTDSSILMAKNTAYNMLPSQLCNALDLYESLSFENTSMPVSIGGVSMAEVGNESGPPLSLDAFLGKGITLPGSKRVPGVNLSRSCESLSLYESVDFSVVSGHQVPSLHERKRRYMAKSTSLSATEGVKAPITSIQVGHLVRQFEAQSPVVDTDKTRPLFRAKNSSLTSFRPMSAALTEARPPSSLWQFSIFQLQQPQSKRGEL